jgi:hypothetical protein
MKTQHDSIDTASDLRDLIAQTPEELEPSRQDSEPLVVVDAKSFREMRVALKMYLFEIKYLTHYRPEYREQVAKEAQDLLNRTEYDKVKRIY